MATPRQIFKRAQAYSKAALAAAVVWLPCYFNAAADRLSAPNLAGTDMFPIYTWVDNSPGWDRSLHIVGYRMGCDTGDPEGCVRQAEAEVKRRDLTRIFLSMDEDSVHTPSDALEYSRLSLSRPYLVEAGLDDFVDRYQNLFSKGFWQAASISSTSFSTIGRTHQSSHSMLTGRSRCSPMLR